MTENTTPATCSSSAGQAGTDVRPPRARRTRALAGVAATGLALGLATALPGIGDPQTTVCPTPGGLTATCAPSNEAPLA